MNFEPSTSIPLQGLVKSHRHLGPVRVGNFLNVDALKIVTYHWDVDNPKGTILLVHGIASNALFEFLELHHAPEKPVIPTPTVMNQVLNQDGSGSPNDENTHPESKAAKAGKSSKSAVKRKMEVIEKLRSVSMDSLEDTDGWYLSYYSSIVQYLNLLGLSVCAMDLQGHGRSSAWNNYACNVASFDNFAIDLVHLMVILRNESKPTYPFFFMGTSMGGGIVIRAAQLFRAVQFYNQNMPHVMFESRTMRTKCSKMQYAFELLGIDWDTINLRGVVSLCPCLRVDASAKQFLNRLMLPIAPLVTKRWPNLRVASIAQHPQYDYIRKMRELDSPNLYSHHFPVRISTEVLKAGETIMNSVFTLNDGASLHPISFLLIHSKQDMICDASGSSDFYEVVKNEASDSTLILLDNMWHMLLVEPEKEDNLVSILTWLKNRI